MSTSLQAPKFGAGKTYIFSDFDGTYFPSTVRTLSETKHISELPFLQKYFEKVDKFLKQPEARQEVILTTARNEAELNFILKLAKKIGLNLPLPKRIVMRNGGDEYLDFAEKKLNEAKRQRIKDQTGWDGTTIREILRNALKKMGMDVEEHDTTLSGPAYGKMSAIAHIEDVVGQPSPWKGVLRKDGDLRFYVGLPRDMMVIPERRAKYKELKQEIRLGLMQNGQNHHWLNTYKDWEFGYRPSITISPILEGRPLSKSHEVKHAITKAHSACDFVLAAGDGDNDFHMLNPAEYLNLPKDAPIDDPKLMRKYFKANPEAKKALENVPFMGLIIVGKVPLATRLDALLQNYGREPNPKVMRVQYGSLPEGVEKAIVKARQNHPGFSYFLEKQETPSKQLS